MPPSPRPRRLPCALLVMAAAGFWLAGVADARRAEIYAGTWGPAGARQGRVHRYEYSTIWTEISPPGGLADAVWDLEFVAGELWAATHDGPHSVFDASTPHGFSGRAYRWDGATWHDMSPPGGFPSAATTVSEIDGVAHVTVDSTGLYRHDGGTSWTLLDTFALAGQAIVSSTHAGTPMLYVGQDNIDEFWVYDPLGAMPCGAPTGASCQVPPAGVVCSGDCHEGSCIHAMTDFDDGTHGLLVHAGAFAGRMYRWDVPSRLFVAIDRVPERRTIDFTHDNIHGLAAYRGRLWAGFSNGRLWSSPDATGPTWVVERDFGSPNPVSELVAVPADDLLWIGFGGVPYRWSRNDGREAVRTFDGTTYLDRSVPGQFQTGVLTLQSRVPPVECVDAARRTLECDAVPPPSNPFPIPPCVTPGEATFLGEERTDGPCEDSYSLVRTWSVTNPCGVDRTHLECLEILDSTPPVPLAALEPAAPRSPGSPASPASPRSPASACSPPSSAFLRVTCGATDNCDPAPAVSLAVVITRHEVDPVLGCVPTVERLPAACGDEFVVELVAAPCPARDPRSASAPSSPRSGPAVHRGESVVFEVSARDRCGNVATLAVDPTVTPASACDEPLVDGACCPLVAAPEGGPCRVPRCGASAAASRSPTPEAAVAPPPLTRSAGRKEPIGRPREDARLRLVGER